MVEQDLWFYTVRGQSLALAASGNIRILNLPRASTNFGSILRRQADLNV
jgi:hypothetical protein